jgi:hypothetical protein
MRLWILGILLSVIAIAPALVLAYHYRTMPEHRASFEQEKKLEVGATFDVKACKVLTGSKFEMYLEGGNWIKASLTLPAKEEASLVVVGLLNKTTPPSPSVTLLRQEGDQWIVDFRLNVEGRKANLVDLLKSKELLHN